MMPSQRQTPALVQPPKACIEQCKELPEAASLVDLVYEVVPQYAECAILHAQCSAALTERFQKDE